MGNTPTCEHRLKAYLYVSHFLSAWGDRMWQFAVPLLFMTIFVNTLLPSVCFSLCSYVATVLVMPHLGPWIDSSNRWTLMRTSILVENTAIVITSSSIALMLYVTAANGTKPPEWNLTLTCLFSLVLVSGAVGQVFNKVQEIAIERDWVIAISHQLATVSSVTGQRQDNSESLTHLNTTLRQIDLGCKVLAPGIFGLILETAGANVTSRATTGALVLGLWNLMSVPLELVLVGHVYAFVPRLQVKEGGAPPRNGNNEGAPPQPPTPWSWHRYREHPVFLLSLSFSALYMTVLDGGSLNVGYLKWRGVSDGAQGLSRGCGAVFGLVGTWAFPRLKTKFGHSIAKLSVWSVWSFWFSLVPIPLVLGMVGETRASDYTLMGVFVVSRMSLWITDLAESQLMQELVEENLRGIMGACQTATCNLFFILMLVLGLIYSDPKDFVHLVLFSITSVFFSACGFSLWWRNQSS